MPTPSRDRAALDWFVEPRGCGELLADAIDFCGDWIWDPCCGGGTIPSILRPDAIQRSLRTPPIVATRFVSGIWNVTRERYPGKSQVCLVYQANW